MMYGHYPLHRAEERPVSHTWAIPPTRVCCPFIREMVDLHLPENFFEEMACEDFEDESQHVLARAFAIVVEMHASGIAPNYDTYRHVHACI